MIFLPWPSYSSCATSSVLAAGQPKRELQNFCSEGRSCNLGGPCRLSSTRTPSAETPSRIDYVLGNLAPDNSLLRGVPHLELTARHVGGDDNFKIGQRHEVPDFQLALAHDSQSRRLHSTDPDYSPRPSA